MLYTFNLWMLLSALVMFRIAIGLRKKQFPGLRVRACWWLLGWELASYLTIGLMLWDIEQLGVLLGVLWWVLHL